MPRRRLPVRLRLRKARADRAAIWVILDGEKEISTRAGADAVQTAQEALEEYLASRHRPPAGEPNPASLLVAEVIATYLREHAPKSRSADWIGHTAEAILEWRGDKPLSAVRGEYCRMYVSWRTAQRIKEL